MDHHGEKIKRLETDLKNTNKNAYFQITLLQTHLENNIFVSHMKCERQQVTKHDNIINILKTYWCSICSQGSLYCIYYKKLFLKKEKKQKQITRFSNNDCSITTNHIDWKKERKKLYLFYCFVYKVISNRYQNSPEDSQHTTDDSPSEEPTVSVTAHSSPLSGCRQTMWKYPCCEAWCFFLPAWSQ